MGVHGEGVHAANIGVRYVAYFQAIFPMSVHHTHLKVKPPDAHAIDTIDTMDHANATVPTVGSSRDP